jgi:alkylation response protein AidB-like acyl-CoA dehydrogenase
MENELRPTTDAGRAFVELAERHAEEAREGIEERDRSGTFPTHLVESMKASGFTKALVPAELGGGGMTSVHDLAVGLNRLGRVDPSLAIAINMHFATSVVTARNWRGAIEAGDDAQRAAMEVFHGMMAGGTIVMANFTEPGTHLTTPLTEVTKVEGGWRIDGRKIFSTLSPAADVFTVGVRERRDDGPDQSRVAIVFRGTLGQTINDDWDAMGMRASGSGSVTYENCVIPDDLLLAGNDYGHESELSLVVGSAGNLGLIATMLGIAEGAAAHVLHQVTTRKKGPEGRLVSERRGIQHAVAEMRASIATSRALIDRVGHLLDEVIVERPVAEVTIDDLHAIVAEFQTAKLVSNRCAIDAVDKALQLSGGQGYFSSSPLSRAYRDVRAGPFMQIWSPNEAYEYIGKVTLGLPPDVDA